MAISLKRIKIEEKLLWRAYRKSPTIFRFFGSPPYFYFRFRLYGHRDGRFCLIIARIAQQSVLDGTNGFSSFKPCAYCRIAHRADIFAIAQFSCWYEYRSLPWLEMHKKEFLIGQSSRSHATYRRPSLGGFYT